MGAITVAPDRWPFGLSGLRRCGRCCRRAAASRVAARQAAKRLASEQAARQAAARQQAVRTEHARKVAIRRAAAQRDFPSLSVSRRQLQEKYAG